VNVLQAIFVTPVERLLAFFFVRFVAATGSYGWSLVLLSLAVTVLTAPLYYVAELWKIQEQALQKKMARDLASIKKHYSGEKRFYLVRNVHRLNGYRPYYALRTSLGLLIQIPFFFGAYGYLSRFQGYAGKGFLFIADLGRPDSLLWGAALLPFVMTAVNVVSSLLYTRSRSLKDNAQLFLLALVFLVVLYDQPAGLLVYWTMNNVLAMLKNLLLARFLPKTEPAAAAGRGAAAALTRGQAAEWWVAPRCRSCSRCSSSARAPRPRAGASPGPWLPCGRPLALPPTCSSSSGGRTSCCRTRRSSSSPC
jgi:YidC/Oxa1 family membrane protein insertase